MPTKEDGMGRSRVLQGGGNCPAVASATMKLPPGKRGRRTSSARSRARQPACGSGRRQVGDPLQGLLPRAPPTDNRGCLGSSNTPCSEREMMRCGPLRESHAAPARRLGRVSRRGWPGVLLRLHNGNTQWERRAQAQRHRGAHATRQDRRPRRRGRGAVGTWRCRRRLRGSLGNVPRGSLGTPRGSVGGAARTARITVGDGRARNAVIMGEAVPHEPIYMQARRGATRGPSRRACGARAAALPADARRGAVAGLDLGCPACSS